MCRGVSPLALACTSLITYDVEYLFICLLAIHRPSLVRCLLRFWAHLKIRLFAFLLNFKEGSLYTLDKSSLLNIYIYIYILQIFCRVKTCLLILLTLAFHGIVFNFMKSGLSIRSWTVSLVLYGRGVITPKAVQIASYVIFWEFHTFTLAAITCPALLLRGGWSS